MPFYGGHPLLYYIKKEEICFHKKQDLSGIFDSGYGGLTVFDKIRQAMPEYDYIYLGDNARTPYGPRSFEVVYRFTRQAVMKLFSRGVSVGDSGV